MHHLTQCAGTLQTLTLKHGFLALFMLSISKNRDPKFKSLTPMFVEIQTLQNGFYRSVMCKQPDGSDISSLRCQEYALTFGAKGLP